MKILCLTPWFPAHPEDQDGSYILDSLEALHALGCESSVLLIKSWRPTLKPKSPCVNNAASVALKSKYSVLCCHYLSIPRHYLMFFSNWCLFKRLTIMIERFSILNNCQIIHAHSELYAAAAVAVGKRLNIPVIITIHGQATVARYWKGFGVKNRNALKNAARIVFVGESIVPWFKQLVGKSAHFKVVSNGFRFSPVLLDMKNMSWSTIVKIVSVSNLNDEGKCIDISLLALAELCRQGITDWTYTIVGDGVLRKSLESLAISLGLQKKVNFVGACSHDLVYDYLNKANIFCLPSCREAFGIAHLEAMAAGLLTIGVEGQGPATFIKHNFTGLLVEPNNVNALASLLEQVFINRVLMQAIARQGQAYVQAYFTWNVHAKKLNAVYQAALA